MTLSLVNGILFVALLNDNGRNIGFLHSNIKLTLKGHTAHREWKESGELLPGVGAPMVSKGLYHLA